MESNTIEIPAPAPAPLLCECGHHMDRHIVEDDNSYCMGCVLDKSLPYIHKCRHFYSADSVCPED